MRTYLFASVKAGWQAGRHAGKRGRQEDAQSERVAWRRRGGAAAGAGARPVAAKVGRAGRKLERGFLSLSSDERRFCILLHQRTRRTRAETGEARLALATMGEGGRRESGRERACMRPCGRARGRRPRPRGLASPRSAVMALALARVNERASRHKKTATTTVFFFFSGLLSSEIRQKQERVGAGGGAAPAAAVMEPSKSILSAK